MAEVLLLLVNCYLVLGILFAFWFAAWGANRIDPVATKGTWGFRLLLLPGAAVLWPWLLVKCTLTRNSDASK